MSDERLIDRLRASFLGRWVYQVKCGYRALLSPLRDKADARYLASIPEKVKALEQKEQITVLFFAMHPAYWRCDSIYRAMLEHPRFRPVIVVCGSVEHGQRTMLDDQARMEAYLQEKGYDYLKGYDTNRANKLLDIRKEVNPDVLCYTKPYLGILPRPMEYDAFFDKLFLHVPYGIPTANPPEICNTRYGQLSWLQFYESPNVFVNSPIKKSNTRLVGSIMLDLFNERRSYLEKQGLLRTSHRKRIIWAPHHSIGTRGTLCYSNFPEVADKFLQLTRRYADRIDFVFKPHPLLYATLCNYSGWGRQRTDAYYKEWTRENRSTVDGSYIDLFLQSDALIHDCASFTAEYLLTGNPALYLAKAHHADNLNKQGAEAYAAHYHAGDMLHVEHFIDDVVLGGIDPMRPAREAFFRDNLASPVPGCTVTQNIINEILRFHA